MVDVDARSAEIRRSGVNPEQLKASIRASLRSVENIDFDAITKQALASVDQAQIEASIAAAQDSVRAAEAQLDQLDSLDDD
jgi:hypothetical protein